MKQEHYQVEQTSEGYIYRLPSRNSIQIRNLAFFMLALGIFGMLFMLAWIATPVAGGIGMLAQNNLFGLASIAFGTLGLIGLYPIWRILAAAVAVLRNDFRCDIEIRAKHLYCTELMGWTSWKRKTLISNISRLEIVKAKEISPNLPGTIPNLDSFALIKAVSENEEKSFRLAFAYGDSILIPLAQELALQLNKKYEPSYSKDAKGITKPVSTIVTTTTLSDDEDSDCQIQPANSRIEIIRKDKSIAFSVPPAGKKGTHGLYWSSIAMLSITSLISIGFICAVFSDDGFKEFGIWGMIGLIAFLSLFFAVGIGVLLGALNMAKRTVMLSVNNGALFIERKSIFAIKWIEFERKNVAAICKGPSGMTINDVPVTELQIIDTEGAKQGLLSQLPANEISWLVYELTVALGVPSGLGDPKSLAEIIERAKSHPNWPQPPIGGLELVQLTAKCRAISIPPHGLATRIGSILTGGTLIILGLIVGPILIFYSGEMIVGLIALGVLAVVGSLIVYFSLNHALTRFDIVAISNSKEDSIGILKNGFLEKRQFDFPRGSALKMRIATNDMQANNKMIFSLKIKNENASVNLMSGHRLVDIRYVAAHLAQWIEEESVANI